MSEDRRRTGALDPERSVVTVCFAASSDAIARTDRRHLQSIFSELTQSIVEFLEFRQLEFVQVPADELG